MKINIRTYEIYSYFNSVKLIPIKSRQLAIIATSAIVAGTLSKKVIIPGLQPMLKSPSNLHLIKYFRSLFAINKKLYPIIQKIQKIKPFNRSINLFSSPSAAAMGIIKTEPDIKNRKVVANPNNFFILVTLFFIQSPHWCE